ncbi:MAG: response regulator, partial [Candidatus Atribacteria bacterium]|nr:response regulator [Candidatus Atribacteria bacterium]
YLKFNQLTVNDGLPENTVYSIVQDKFGFMWFGTWSGAVKYDGYELKIYRANENDSLALPDNRISAIVTDSMQNIWIKTRSFDDYFKYNYDYDNFTRYLSDNAPSEVIELINEHDNVKAKVVQNKFYQWRSDYNGLIQKNKTTGDSIIYLPDYSNSFSITDNIIHTVYLDECEILWVGTQSGGVNYAITNIKPFSYYHVDKGGSGLVENAVRAICRDKEGALWIGSDDKGITIIDPLFKDNKYNWIGSKYLNNLIIRALLCDKRGNVWIGTKGGLVKYDVNLDKFIQCSESICDPNVFTLLQDHEGTLWVGTFNGIATYEEKIDRFNCIDPASSTGGLQIRDIIEDRYQNLWVATEDSGITKLVRAKSEKSSDMFTPIRYMHKEGNENSLINNRTFSLTEDKHGMIWVATNSGLSRLNPTDNTFKHFTRNTGLPNDNVMSVMFDGNESVWFSHKRGLTRMNIETFELQSFNMNDGLQGFEFNQSTSFRDELSGEMFFGGSNGLNSFFPDSIKINPFKPNIVFTRLSVMNRELNPGTKVNKRVILEKSILCTNKITLTWWDKTFSLEFSALQYANPIGNKYKYRLLGYDKEWVYVDASKRIAQYSNLPSGQYRLEVFASNSDGVWCDNPAVLDIEVLPPWWLAWWAIAVYIVVGLLIGLFVFKYIASKIELRKNELIHQAKLKFFTEISHEFRTPLTLIIDPLDKIISGKLTMSSIRRYSIVMQRNAKQLLALINQLLDFRKLESGQLTLKIQKTDFVNFTRALASSFHLMAEQRNIRFEVVSDIDHYDLGFDSSKIKLVLNNLISNAFKFTPDGGIITIKIEMPSKLPDGIIISVIDSGNGISKEDQVKVFDLFYQSEKNSSWQSGSGIGLALTKELVQLHKGTITIQSEVNKGTRFTVFLPANENVINVSQDDEININTIDLEEHIDHSPENISNNRPLLLVVDDNTDIRNYIEMNLSSSYQIIKASNGRIGIDSALDSIPDIIVSDVMMPEMDGFELCRRLKLDERTSHIPIILLTARQSDESRVEGYETGADAYLTKPFSSVVLQAQIQNLLEQRQKLREIFQKGTDIEIKKIAINVTDEAFLNKVIHHIHENLEDEEFNINALSELLKMSRSQFYRKIKALTNQSLLDFVTTIRMNKALEYLLSGDYNISETAYKVGYSMQSNFSRTFTRHFGLSPSKYIESIRK